MANRSNIMGLHGLKNKPHRNSFDLSHRNLFTAKVGELLPCAVFEMNPGDSIKLDSSYFTRTAPLQSAAFTRLRENIQFFFVPYSMLWKYFETQVINMTKTAAGGDVSRIASSPFDNEKVTTEMPYISYLSLHSYLIRQVNSFNGSDNVAEEAKPHLFNNGEYRYSASAKLLQMLGYGNFKQMNLAPSKRKNEPGVEVRNAPNLSIFRLLAYQKICNDHYTYRQWQPYDAALCNIDYLKPGSSKGVSVDSQVDSIDFGSDNSKSRRLNFLDLRFSNLPLDYLNGVLPVAQYGDESAVALDIKNTLNLSTGGHVVNAFDDNRDLRLTNVRLYTDDNSALPVGLNPVGPFGASSDMQVGNNDSPKGPYTWRARDRDVSSVGADGTSFKGHAVDYSSKWCLSSISLNGGVSGSLGIVALRNAMAMQRYKEIQLAYDVDFVSLIEAHFGVKPKKSDTTSYFIGGASSMIDINPQVNQNLAGDGQADYKAAPIGNGKASMKFTADTYGVVMGIYRCTPVLDYAHVGIDRTLLKTDASDFVIPELDSIGMQQTFDFELRAPSIFGDESLTKSQIVDMSTTYGFAPRYAEYKTSFDRYNGDFCFSLGSWVTGLSNKWLDKYSLMPSDPTELFNCRPDIVNSIFLNQRNRLVSDDKLYVGLVNMAYATRNLSRYGLPYSN